MLVPDLLLQVVNFGREEFHRTAAFRAHHVVVAAAIVLVLVTGDAVVKSDFTSQTALGQQFEGAVDGGESDLGIFFLH